MSKEESNAVDRRRVSAFAARVRALRESHGLSQEQLAEDAGLHRAVVGFIERGEREPGITNALRLADGLDMTLSELLQDVDAKIGTHAGPRRR